MVQRVRVVADVPPDYEPICRTGLITREQLEDALSRGWVVSGSKTEGYEVCVVRKAGLPHSTATYLSVRGAMVVLVADNEAKGEV